MLGQRLRRWSNIEPTLNKCTMFERKSSCPANTRHLYNNYTTSWQDVGPHSTLVHIAPTLHKVIQMFCVYWACQYKLGSSSFNIPAVIQSVCLQANNIGIQVNRKEPTNLHAYSTFPFKKRERYRRLAIKGSCLLPSTVTNVTRIRLFTHLDCST